VKVVTNLDQLFPGVLSTGIDNAVVALLKAGNIPPPHTSILFYAGSEGNRVFHDAKERAEWSSGDRKAKLGKIVRSGTVGSKTRGP
jgi:hypothetical protein